MKRIEDKLDLVIITYNRAQLLLKTLTSLQNSPLKDCQIHVLNNCSTDNTLRICSGFTDSLHLKIVTNRFNIGGDANILRACELADKEYLWILADDDEYNFENCDDVLTCILNGSVNLIHVGAHTDVKWRFGGELQTTQKLVSDGYSFFRFSSFIPCSIFRVSSFIPYAIKGYQNISNLYPHMPFLLSFYTEDKPIYISKSQVVKAVMGHQSYNEKSFTKGWLQTSYLLKNKQSRALCFFDQYTHTKRGSKVKIFLTLSVGAAQGKISWNTLRVFNLINLVDRLLIAVSIIPFVCFKLTQKTIRDRNRKR